jgi:adenylate cyclase
LSTERAERRLAAILAADVAGYSRLMEADEEGTLRQLKRRRALIARKIARYRGRIVKSTGDGMLVESRKGRGCGALRRRDPTRHG